MKPPPARTARVSIACAPRPAAGSVKAKAAIDSREAKRGRQRRLGAPWPATESGKRTFYLGRYNCVEQLGTGPLGDTFRAKIYGVAGFEKQFAVKRLHANLTADDPFVARFVPAASAFAALDHQRIARVHE